MPDGVIAPAATATRASARFCDSIRALRRDDWERMCPGHGENWDYLSVLETVPPPGFTLGAIVVERGGRTIAGAPVFRTTYRFDTSFQGRLRRLSDQVYRVMPRALSMDVLSLGSPLADLSLIGFDPGLDEIGRRHAVREMMGCLEAEAKRSGAPLVAAKGLDAGECESLGEVFSTGSYQKVTTLPNVVLELPFTSIDGYLASLPDGTARYLKRKWRSAGKVRIEYRQSLDGLKDEVNALYRATIAQSRWDYGNFGPLHPDYFDTVARALGDRARLMLCWADGELLSFQLFLAGRDEVPAKGIGMRYPRARELNLYFLNWKEMIEFCIANGIPRISMAGTTYSTKLMMGGRLQRQWLFFRFTNTLMNATLPWLAPLFDFESNDPELRDLPVDGEGRLKPKP